MHEYSTYSTVIKLIALQDGLVAKSCLLFDAVKQPYRVYAWLILTLKRYADDQAGPCPYGGAGPYTCTHPCDVYQAVRDAVLLGSKESSFFIIFY